MAVKLIDDVVGRDHGQVVGPAAGVAGAVVVVVGADTECCEPEHGHGHMHEALHCNGAVDAALYR